MIMSKVATGVDPTAATPHTAESIRRSGMIRRLLNAVSGSACRFMATLFCMLLGLALIINNQFAGEASWFWDAELLHRGFKLYGDLHLVLQPLMILEMDAWMRLFGTKCLVYEIPAVIHLLVLCIGLFLIMGQSDWPDWQKAIVIVGSFVFWIAGSSYRFDDYHVTTESFVLYSLLLLLLIAKTDAPRRQIGLSTSMGVLCAFAVTSRINDGAALFVATVICLPLLARKRKALITGLFAAVFVLAWLAIIRCTGDSFSVYLASTLTRAVGSKGGTATVLSNPLHLFVNAERLRHGIRWLFRAVIFLSLIGALVQRVWKKGPWIIFLIQLAISPAIFALSSTLDQQKIPQHALMDLASCSIVVATYLLSIVVAVRCGISVFRSGKRNWDAREALILFPLGQLASIASSAAGKPQSGYYAEMVLLVLLWPLLQPTRRQWAWVNGAFLSILLWGAVVGTIHKWNVPYSWNSFYGQPMFVNRQWYWHPVYGPMYIQTDLLQFMTSTCADIGGIGGSSDVLSLPFSYPNYFCDTPPWHGYVQTFIDITSISTMNKLIGELQTSPPEWIIYQRQTGSLREQEKAFNHGNPSKQRELDKLIIRKLSDGEWKRVDFKRFRFGDDWYVIRTRQ